MSEGVASGRSKNEQKCDDCGRENPVWFAANEVWNAVIPGCVAMLCPICFIRRAEQDGYQCTGWQLVPERFGRTSARQGDTARIPDGSTPSASGKPDVTDRRDGQLSASGRSTGAEQGYPPRIYGASRASLPARPAMWKQLRSEGFNIISSWIDEAEPGATADLSELWARIVAEISSADGIVFYVEADDFPLKGALIEVGIALGMGKAVHVVFPDLEISAPSYRPIGSWVMHPNVVRFKNVRQACQAKFVAELAESVPSQESDCSCFKFIREQFRIEYGREMETGGGDIMCLINSINTLLRERTRLSSGRTGLEGK